MGSDKESILIKMSGPKGPGREVVMGLVVKAGHRGRVLGVFDWFHNMHTSDQVPSLASRRQKEPEFVKELVPVSW